MGISNGCTGLSRRLDIFKAMAEKLHKREAVVKSYLAPRVSQPMYCTTTDLQRAYENALESIKDHFRKLRDVVIRYKIKKTCEV